MARLFDWKWVLALALLALLFLLGSSAVTVSAQGPTPDPQLVNRMDKIAKELYCPVCAGTPLNICETKACQQWRDLIIEKLKAGESEAQIRQYFIDQYGDRVLGAPPPQGFNLGAYITPLLIMLGGLVILFFTLRTWLHRSSPSATSGPVAPVATVAPEVAERIARELRESE